MSLTLLPAVDVRDGKAVRLRQGESGSETDYGSPFEAARTWVEAGAEWIHLVDLDAAFGTGNNRDQLREIVHELGDRVNIELSGGVRDDASLDAALEAGAARVNIGTAALEIRIGPPRSSRSTATAWLLVWMCAVTHWRRAAGRAKAATCLRP